MTRTTTATAWIAGGLLWTLAGLVHKGSYEALWLPADALLLVGLLGLWLLNLHRGAQTGRIGLIVALVGRIVFIVAEIMSIAQDNDENLLLPLGALGSAVGLTVYGAAVLRSGLIDTPLRFAPLLAGVYPFATMFPIVIARGGEPSLLAIALWGIPMALLGLALATAEAHQRPAA